jgi:hypothetical protein
MDVDLYDGGGDMSGPLSVPFSNGLFIRQRNSNSVSTTFTGTAYAPTTLPNTQA